jgi:hypothetical protein
MLMIFLCAASAGAISLDALGDSRVSALGSTYTAIADDSNTLFLNPAGLRLLAGTDLSVRLDVEDYVLTSVLEDPAAVIYPNSPILGGELLYTSRNWGISAFTEYYMTIPEDHGENFTIDRVGRFNSMHFGMGFGFGPLSLGANIKASQQAEKTDVPFEDSNIANLGSSFVSQVLFGEFNPNPVETVTMGAGALFTVGSFSLGAYSDTFIDFMYGFDDRLNMDVEQILRELSVGVSYQTPAYDRNGNYHPFQLIAAADIHDFGDDGNREFTMGAEANIRYLEFAQLALRAGYRQPLAGLDDLLFGLEPRLSAVSAGVGVVLPFIKVDASASLPTQALIDRSIEDELRAQLTFGFSF